MIAPGNSGYRSILNTYSTLNNVRPEEDSQATRLNTPPTEYVSPLGNGYSPGADPDQEPSQTMVPDSVLPRQLSHGSLLAEQCVEGDNGQRQSMIRTREVPSQGTVSMSRSREEPNRIDSGNDCMLPPEWDDILPDVMIRCLRAIPSHALIDVGMKDFYKSYPTWNKMTADQRNRAIAWFRQLPDEMQGIFFCCSCWCAPVSYMLLQFPLCILFYLLLLDDAVTAAIEAQEKQVQEEAATNLVLA